MWKKVSSKNREQILLIKEWVEKLAMLKEDDVVSISEINCVEENCPPVETVITIFFDSGNKKMYKIAKPIETLILDDIFEAILTIGPNIKDEGDCC